MRLRQGGEVSSELKVHPPIGRAGEPAAIRLVSRHNGEWQIFVFAERHDATLLIGDPLLVKQFLFAAVLLGAMLGLPNLPTDPLPLFLNALPFLLEVPYPRQMGIARQLLEQAGVFRSEPILLDQPVGITDDSGHHIKALSPMLAERHREARLPSLTRHFRSVLLSVDGLGHLKSRSEHAEANEETTRM
jgi:hypothetical protein